MTNNTPNDLPIELYISKVIKERRQFLNLTQKYTAEQLGISIQQLQKYENGQNKVSTSKLVELSKVLKFNMADIFKDYETYDKNTLKDEGFMHENDKCNACENESVQLFSKVKCKKTKKKFASMLNLTLFEEGD